MKYCRKIIVLIAFILLFVGNIAHAQTSIVSAVAQLTNSTVTVNVTLQNEQGMICAALVDGETTVAVTTKEGYEKFFVPYIEKAMAK